MKKVIEWKVGPNNFTINHYGLLQVELFLDGNFIKHFASVAEAKCYAGRMFK